MKKYFNYLGIMAAAAMTLVSCAKEIDTVSKEDAISEEGIPFEFVANPETKTTIDGLQTKWAAADAVNLFHAVAGSTTYVSDGEFTIASEDLATGTFKGTLSESLASGSYDWYAVYPYSSYKKDPSSTSDGYITVGSKANETQTQNGNSNTDHLAGADYPLSGTASAVAFNEKPAITLASLCSFVKINVTNSSGSPLIVSSVDFTAPESIIGTYYINITDPSNLTYVGSGASYVSETARLSVTGGAEIPDGGSAQFYIGIKPFTASAGSEFTVSVNGYKRTITTTKVNTFQAGKIKTVSFDYDITSKTYTLYTGSIVEGDYLIVADDAAMKASIASNRFGYTNVAVVSNSISTSDASIVWHIAPSGDYWTFYNEDAAQYAGGNGTKNQGALLDDASGDGAKWTIVSGASPVITNYGNDKAGVNATLRRNDTYGFACYGTSTGTAPVFYKYDDPSAKVVKALKTSIDDVLAAGVSAAFESEVYELVNATDVDITVTFDGTVVTDATAADGDVLYDVAANTGAARSGWIKIAVAGGNAIQIDVNQLAGVAGKTYTITWNSTNNSKGVTSYTDDWTVTADGITCNMQNFNNNSNKWEYVKCGRKNNASVATIITAVAIPETIKTVTLTIDALTAAKINSIKLYTSSDSSSWTEAGSFSKSTGDQSVIISSPAANLYYKIECDCASGSSNGLLTISKLIITTY